MIDIFFLIVKRVNKKTYRRIENIRILRSRLKRRLTDQTHHNLSHTWFKLHLSRWLLHSTVIFLVFFLNFYFLSTVSRRIRALSGSGREISVHIWNCLNIFRIITSKYNIFNNVTSTLIVQDIIVVDHMPRKLVLV